MIFRNNILTPLCSGIGFVGVFYFKMAKNLINIISVFPKVNTYVFFVLLFIFINSATAELNMFYDYSLFRYNNDSTIVEFYYSFIDTDVKYVKSKKDIIEACLNISIVVTNLTNNQITYKDNWNYPILKNENDSSTIFSFLGIRKSVLEAGNYRVEFTTIDNNNTCTKVIDSLNINVIKFEEGDRPQVSGLLLANRIEHADNLTFAWDEMFRKDNLYILPNPSLEFTSNSPDLQFYFEVYNHNISKPQNIAVFILDANKREMSKSILQLTSANNSFGKKLTVPLDLLPTGVYYLVINLLSENGNTLDISSKKFFYINNELKPMLSMYFTEDQIFEQSEFITMDEKALNTEYRKARIIGSNEEMDKWNNLTDNKAKQRFLYRFWRDRDSDPSTVTNETKALFEERVKYANKHFAITKDNEGWNTDRGRTLLKYGEPTMIDKQEVVGLRKAYQIWHYDEIQGGVIFVFVDQVGIGHYTLVHSTAHGEISNPNWYNQYILKQKQFDQ